MTKRIRKVDEFIPDQALDVLSGIALNKETVRAWVYSQLHPEISPACPVCSEPIKSQRALENFRSGGRVSCRVCKKFFTNRAGTILSGSHLEFEQFYLMTTLLAFAVRTKADLAVSRREIARLVGICPNSVHAWQKVFEELQLPIKQICSDPMLFETDQ